MSHVLADTPNVPWSRHQTNTYIDARQGLFILPTLLVMQPYPLQPPPQLILALTSRIHDATVIGNASYAASIFAVALRGTHYREILSTLVYMYRLSGEGMRPCNKPKTVSIAAFRTMVGV